MQWYLQGSWWCRTCRVHADALPASIAPALLHPSLLWSPQAANHNRSLGGAKRVSCVSPRLTARKQHRDVAWPRTPQQLDSRRSWCRQGSVCAFSRHCWPAQCHRLRGRAQHRGHDGRIQQREFTKPFGPCVRFDVFVCLGVAEHIPRDHEETFLRNVNCSAGDGLILSWAPPGQSGTGHVNLRSRADVIARLGALGFAVDAAASRFLGDQATLHWFKRNMLALRRRGQPSPFALDAPAVVEARGSVTTSDQSTAEEPTASSIVAALNKMRAGYAKLEARLDELHLRSTDVLLRSAMDEQLKGLHMLARVAPRIAAQST